jgi:hypothetical protein
MSDGLARGDDERNLDHDYGDKSMACKLGTFGYYA